MEVAAMFSSGNLATLKCRGLLDPEGHPKAEAYKIAINTISSDLSSLCKQLWEHSDECAICSIRANQALQEAYKL